LAAQNPTVRPYRAGDERELVQLFRQVFGTAITEAHWRWKLQRALPALDNVWLAVSADDKPVFQYAGIPTRFSLAGHPTTVMVSVDTMTAVEYRRRGLLTQVAQQAYSNWQQNGIAFVFGLPNNQWGSRTRALGWQALFPLQWLVRPLRPQALIARRLKIPLVAHAPGIQRLWNGYFNSRLRTDRTVQTEYVREADESFDRIWEKCSLDSLYSTVRDRDWLQRRFLSSPSGGYEISLARRKGEPTGYCVHRLIRAGERVSACIADILVPAADPDSRDALLRVLIEDLLPTGAETLTALAVPGTSTFLWLRRAGFFPRHAFSTELVPLAAQLPMESMRDPSNWNLNGADFDVV
jgi:hypothetical protein